MPLQHSKTLPQQQQNNKIKTENTVIIFTYYYKVGCKLWGNCDWYLFCITFICGGGYMCMLACVPVCVCAHGA